MRWKVCRMSIHASGTLEMKSWDEQTWDGRPHQEVSGRKFTVASVTNVFRGDIEGDSTLRYLMAHADDSTCETVGLEHVVGRIGERTGSFVLQHIGSFQDGVAEDTWTVVPDSGTGELAGLRGTGGCVWAETGATFTLDYEVEALTP
jgi:hypothetical protein